MVFSQEEQKIILNQVRQGHDKFYKLFCVVVMPDHVHMIIQPFPDYSLSQIMKGTKGTSSRLMNKLRGTHQNIWQIESFDRIIRNDNEFLEKFNYIVNNAFKEGLVTEPLKYHGLYIAEDLK